MWSAFWSLLGLVSASLVANELGDVNGDCHIGSWKFGVVIETRAEEKHDDDDDDDDNNDDDDDNEEAGGGKKKKSKAKRKELLDGFLHTRTHTHAHT